MQGAAACAGGRNFRTMWGVATNLPNPDLGKPVAEALRRFGVRGILVTAAEEGYLTELRCQMPECLCPEELGGREYFEKVTEELPQWMPSHDHIQLKSEGGHRTVENSRLGHRLCNRVDYNKNHGISYAKDLASADAARRDALGQPQRDPSSNLSDALVAPGKTLKDKARFIKENLKDPQTQKNLKDLAKDAPRDFVTDMKGVVSLFRRKKGTGDDRTEGPEMQGSESSSGEEPARELLDIEDFRDAVEQGLPILNVDLPTATEVLHRRPHGCSGVDEKWFVQKVIENDRTTGGYFVIADERGARKRWPQMSPCKRCS